MVDIVKTEKITINTDEKSIQHTNHSKKLFYNTDGFSNNKQYVAFIKSVEKTIRGSVEYREWTSYLREACGAIDCKITHETVEDCTIEIHHYPFNLFQLVDICIETKMQNKEKFSTFDIANEVMSWHFRDIVGYIPLISSLHEKYHNGLLQIPLWAVSGNWKTILSEFSVPEEVRDAIASFRNIATFEGVPTMWEDGILKEGA